MREQEPEQTLEQNGLDTRKSLNRWMLTNIPIAGVYIMAAVTHNETAIIFSWISTSLMIAVAVIFLVAIYLFNSADMEKVLRDSFRGPQFWKLDMIYDVITAFILAVGGLLFPALFIIWSMIAMQVFRKKYSFE